MTDDETNRRRRLAVLIGSGALVVAAGVAIVLAVTGPSDADDQATDPSTSQSASPTPSKSTAPPVATSSATPEVTPDAPVESPVPVPPIDARPPVVVPPDEVVDAGGVQVTLTGFTNVTTSGTGPGEISGPGVEVAISITNTGSEAADLSALTVNVYQGAEGIPLATVTSDQDNRPVPAKLDAGATSTGTYRFVSTGSDDEVYAVVIDVSPDTAPVVYQGVHPS